MVMAAGVNYNGVWAALGKPVSLFDVHKQPYHIAGLRRVRHRLGRGLEGEALEGRRRGRHPLQPGRRRRRGVQRRRPDELALPADLGLRDRRTARFAQFCRVQSRQLMPRPRHLTWEESRLLRADAGDRLPDAVRPSRRTRLKPGDNVLVWGGAGGLGSMAIQMIAASGANAIAVISEEDKRDFVMSPGCQGGDQPQGLRLLGRDARPDGPGGLRQVACSEARKFGKAIWDDHRQGQRRRHGVRAPGRRDLPGLGPGLQARRHGGDLRRHHRLQAHASTPATCGCARSACRAATSPTSSRPRPPTASCSTGRSTPA